MLRQPLQLIKTLNLWYFTRINKYSMANLSVNTYEEVLQFWFGNGPNSKLWFGGGPEIDQEIKDKFGDLVLKARNGDLANWENLELGNKAGLAFIILLDQFCRNIYRGSAETFSHDYKSLAVASKLVDEGIYKEFTPAEKFFLFLPFEHHESMDMQNKAVAMFTELAELTKGTEDEMIGKSGLDFAIQHKDVIEKYGRFPGRNKALSRENTKEEEEEYFAQNKYKF